MIIDLKYPSSGRQYLKLWILSVKMIFWVYLYFQCWRCTRAGKSRQESPLGMSVTGFTLNSSQPSSSVCFQGHPCHRCPPLSSCPVRSHESRLCNRFSLLRHDWFWFCLPFLISPLTCSDTIFHLLRVLVHMHLPFFPTVTTTNSF